MLMRSVADIVAHVEALLQHVQPFQLDIMLFLSFQNQPFRCSNGKPSGVNLVRIDFLRTEQLEHISKATFF